MLLKKLNFAAMSWLLLAVITAGQQAPQSSVDTNNPNSVAGAPGVAPEAASASAIQRTGSCDFTYNNPRFYNLEAEVTVQGVETNSPLLNDALIGLVRDNLNLDPCQLGMSQGTNCTSGTQQLPCSDPMFNCGNGIAISQDVYTAAVNGDCNTSVANNTLVCTTLASNPDITTAVLSGACKPSCLSGYPQSTQDFPVSCISFILSIDAATKDSVVAAATALGNPWLQGNISNGLSNFANGPGAQFLVVNSAFRPVIGYGSFPPPPPPVVPIEPLGLAQAVNASTVALASASVLVYGPWSTCVPSCGNGFSTRTASCFAPDGTLLPLQSCPEGINATTSQPCSSACPDSYYEYSSWSACNVTCGGGVATRTAQCLSPSSGTAQCNSAPTQPTTMACNTAPCSSYSWTVSEWSVCNVKCGGGNSTRTVMCVDSTGLQVPDEKCTGRKPRSSQQCNLQACDFCANNVCLGRGTCQSNATTCLCNPEYKGAYCEIPVSCPSGVVDANLACCPSGLVNVHGDCCPTGNRLDANGECCSQSLDVCGVCGGNGAFVDMQGSCCTVADANGICCPSGLVDECGVCDGTGNSCTVQIATQIQVPPELVQGLGVSNDTLTQFFQSALGTMGLPADSISVTNLTTDVSPTLNAGRRLSQYTPTSAPALAPAPLPQSLPGSYVEPVPSPPPPPLVGPQTYWAFVSVTPSSNVTGDTPFQASYIAASLPGAVQSINSTTGIQLTGKTQPGRLGVCGNGICEIGERSTVGAINGSCTHDCGMPAVACVGGCGVGGNCLPATGVCQCYVGYQGNNCATCSSGFVRTGGVCVASVTALKLINPQVIGPDGHALVNGDPPGTHSGPSTGVIVGAVIGAIAGLALLLFGFCMVRRCLLRRKSYDDNNNKVGNSTLPHGAMVSNQLYDVDEEIGLRQRYGKTDPRPGSHNDNNDVGYHVYVDGTGVHNNNATGYTSNTNSARDDGWQSARDDHFSDEGGSERGSARDYVLNMDGYGAQPFASHSLHYQPAHVMQRKSTFDLPADAETHYSGRMAAPPVASPPLPGVSEDIRASSKLSLSSAAASSSHSQAVSLASIGGEKVPSRPQSARVPEPRLFYNPAYSLEGKNGGSQSARSAFNSARSDASIDERRARLDALRAAVKALEQQKAAATTMGNTHDKNTTKGVVKEDQKSAVFLPGRPAVPRLSLANLSHNNNKNNKNVTDPHPSHSMEGKMRSEALIKAHHSYKNDVVIAAAQVRQPEVQQVHLKQQHQLQSNFAKSVLTTIKDAVTPPPFKQKPQVLQSADFREVIGKIDTALERASPEKKSKVNRKGGGNGAIVGDGSGRKHAETHVLPTRPSWR